MRKFTVLYIDNTIGFGGATKSLSLMLGGLHKFAKVILTSQEQMIVDRWYKGYKVYKFRRIINYKNHGLINEFIKKAIPIVLLRKILLKMVAVVDLAVSFANIVRIIWIVKSNKIDLIHINTGFVLEGILASRILKIPCIVHWRGFFPKEENIILRTINLFSHIIGVSIAVSNSIPSDRVPKSKISTIYDPVDLALYDRIASERTNIRKKWNLSDEDIAVGIFGRVIPWKGQLEFVHAVLNVMKVNRNVKAVIVGDKSDGTVEYFDQVKDIINSSGFKNHFIFTGYQEDVEAYYFAMDIIVHASIEPEPFGMVIPEGMAAKKPVIATDAGGPREIIAPGLDGILVRPGDVEEMSSAILELANDPVKRQVMGLNGFNKVRERFNIQSIASEVESVYQKLLSGSTAR